MVESGNGQQRLSGIQLLRGLAALLIVFYHSGNALSGFADQSLLVRIPFIYDRGYYAVDLFFAISGFIICHVFDRGSFSLPQFYFRRFWRIYPVYWIFCLAAILWFRAGLPQLGDDPGWDNIIASALIIPQPDFPIYAVGWTLEHEIVFYLLAGLVLPLLGKWGLFILLVALGVISWSGVLGSTWTFHLFSAPQLQFAAGVFAYLTYRAVPQRLPWWLLAGLGAAFYLLPEVTIYDLSNHRLFLMVGSCLLIYAVLRFNFDRTRRLEKLAILGGDLTYSLYLVHWIVFPVVGILGLYVSSPILAEPFRWFAILVVIGASYVFHRLVEQPLLRLGRPIERTAGVLYRRVFRQRALK